MPLDHRFDLIAQFVKTYVRGANRQPFRVSHALQLPIVDRPDTGHLDRAVADLPHFLQTARNLLRCF